MITGLVILGNNSPSQSKEMKTIKLGYLLVVSVISLFVAENESAQNTSSLQLQQAKEAIAKSNAIYFQAFVK
ncbi:MAG: hypothetical protein ABUL46_00690 [Chitinophaga rupis]